VSSDSSEAGCKLLYLVYYIFTLLIVSAGQSTNCRLAKASDDRPQRSFCREFSCVPSESPFSLSVAVISRASCGTQARTHSETYRTDRPSLHETLVACSRGTAGTCEICTTTTPAPLYRCCEQCNIKSTERYIFTMASMVQGHIIFMIVITLQK